MHDLSSNSSQTSYIVENHIHATRLIWSNKLRLSVFVLLLLAALPRVSATDIIEVGLLAPRGDAYALAQWQPTLDALNTAIPGYEFRGRALTLDGMTEAVAQAEVDFVLTNPGQFILLGTPYSLSWLATLRSNPAESSRTALGSVLLVRDQSPYREPADLMGQRVVAVHEQAFGGYLLLLPALAESGVRPTQLQVEFLGYPIDALAYQLRDGLAEAAILPVCMLEQMAAEGLINQSSFRALMPSEPIGGCLSSTIGYPDWTFAALPHVPESLAASVAAELLNMDAPEAARWGAPVSAANVATLFDALNLHPLHTPLSDRIRAALTRYWPYTLAGFLVLIGFLGYHAFIQKRAYQHAHALENAQLALRDRERELAIAQNRIVTGELASTLAHEINQPLAAIRSYAEGGLLRLKQSSDQSLAEPLQAITKAADRGAQIVEQARQWVREAPPLPQAVAIEPLFRDVKAVAQHRLTQQHIQLTSEVDPNTLLAYANPLAMEQVLGNLINNSLDAFAESPPTNQGGWIHLQARIDCNEKGLPAVKMILKDNAGGFSVERLANPFEPLTSTRSDGLGLGLSICRRLMQRQGGSLSIANHAAGGAKVLMTLPLYEENVHVDA